MSFLRIDIFFHICKKYTISTYVIQQQMFFFQVIFFPRCKYNNKSSCFMTAIFCCVIWRAANSLILPKTFVYLCQHKFKTFKWDCSLGLNTQTCHICCKSFRNFEGWPAELQLTSRIINCFDKALSSQQKTWL